MMSIAPLALTTALAVTCLSGCASSDTERLRVETTAFIHAVGQRDGARACGYLLPQAARNLESSGSTCAEEILKLDLTQGEVGRVERWGDNVRLHVGDQHVFLSRWGKTWRVAAAGCKPRPHQPDDCEVEA
ncbi:hypothetical protein [Actinomadura sp. 6N118]|uniref:hypothetical protein n=1 Tax=Actinomadura sp. 6N118 TaxID=3375151 RepID=UPI003791C788